MKQDLNETLAFLNEHGFVTEKQPLNETTATTAPEYVFSKKIYDALKSYIKDIKDDIADNPKSKDIGDKLIAALYRALGDGGLMTMAIDQFLDTIGFNQAYNDAWDEHHS